MAWGTASGEHFLASNPPRGVITDLGGEVWNIAGFAGIDATGATASDAGVDLWLAKGGTPGATLFAGPGTYLLNVSQHQIKSNSFIRGSGPATLFKQGFAHGGGVDNQGLFTNADYVNGNTAITFSDFSVLCTTPAGASPTLTGSTAICWFQGVSDFTAFRVVSTGGDFVFYPTPATKNTATVNANGKNQNTRIVDCKVTGAAQAVQWYQGKYLLIIGNTFFNTYDSDISVNSSGEAITIANNILDKQGNTYAALALIEFTNDGVGDTNGIRDVTVTGNVLLNSLNINTKGIQIQKVNHFTVTGNEIRNVAAAGIFCNQACSNGTIAGNVSVANQYGIQLANDVGTMTAITVTGNVCQANTSHGLYLGGGAQAFTNMRLADNILTGNTGQGLNNSVNVTTGIISGNIFASNAGGVFTNSGTGWRIKDNPGLNPVGSQGVTAPGFPATTVGVGNNTAYDVIAYVTAGVNAVTFFVSGLNNGANVVIPANQMVAVTIPAGFNFTPTYAGGVPTWVWYGL